MRRIPPKEGETMKSKFRLSMLCIVGALGAAGCARNYAKLTPAPSASLVSGPGGGAGTIVEGVRVIARSEAWHWDPTNLHSKVTPILIELQNLGSRNVALRYQRITLVDASDGTVFHAMPPYDINASVKQKVTMVYPYSGYAVAPYLSGYYPSLAGYRGAWAYDAGYYSPYYTSYVKVELPTMDMIQRALPEGVLSPDGTANGFVYFESLNRHAGQMNLRIEMVDADSNCPLGTAVIPFMTR
jgi:hypothetical protein